METFKLTFDIMDISTILITFNNFGLKITNYYEMTNTDVVEFEGTYDQLKKWYEEYYNTGEDFKDYFDELLERIRAIRASERRFYQKITDLYAEASIDYDPKAPITQQFYQTVQNKLHWAITGQTAAEIIANRVDAAKPNMGLTTWKNAPEGKILKSDTHIAKNYLNEQEIAELERIVTMYLDYAENQAKRHIPMTMKDWVQKLDAFLQFNEYDVLKDAGKVSAKVAKELAYFQH